MKKSLLFLLALALLALTACSHLKEQPDMDEVTEAALRRLQAIQAKYAPDRHLSVFSVSAEREGDMLFLKGEVDNPDAKGELVQAISQMGIKTVDRIAVLPSEKLGEKTWGIVRLSVANVRENPAQAAEMGTQVLMGNIVRVLKQEGGWYLVQSSDRYVGWMEDDGFAPATKDEVNVWNSADRLIVTNYEARIWQEPLANSLPVSDVVTGGLVKKIGQQGDWFKVELPDGRNGFLAKTAATDYENWRSTRHLTAENIEHTAKSMLGIPYLWGGTSMKGVDCSGFTKTVFLMNGTQLMRNASQQARQGMEVPLDDDFRHLKKGDLLFFGPRGIGGRPDRVIHVGIYLGDKLFIHSSGLVRISSLDPKSPLLDERRLKTLLHARRFLPDSTAAAN